MSVKLWIFSYPLILTFVLGAQKNHLIETVLLSTHNICFGWEIRKIIHWEGLTLLFVVKAADLWERQKQLMWKGGKGSIQSVINNSDFIWDFWKLPFPADLGKYIIKNGKISTKIHEIWKIKTIFGLGMTPI